MASIVLTSVSVMNEMSVCTNISSETLNDRAMAKICKFEFMRERTTIESCISHVATDGFIRLIRHNKC